jgi:hypothetical protein
MTLDTFFVNPIIFDEFSVNECEKIELEFLFSANYKRHPRPPTTHHPHNFFISHSLQSIVAVVALFNTL